MWFWYALLAAMLGAVSTVVNKQNLKSVNASVVTWTLFAFPIPALAMIMLARGGLSLTSGFWLGVVGSAAGFGVSKTLSLSSIKRSVLSLVLPLGSTAVVFTYILGVVFLHESLRWWPIVGLGLIVVGAYVLHVELALKSIIMPFLVLWKEPPSRLLLVAMFLGAVASVFDKVALTSTVGGDVVAVLLAEDILMAAILGGFIKRAKYSLVEQVGKNLKLLMLGALIYTVMSYFGLKGYYNGPIVLSAGVKQLQLVFALGLSWWLFKDKPKTAIWVGTILMMVGVVLIKVF